MADRLILGLRYPGAEGGYFNILSTCAAHHGGNLSTYIAACYAECISFLSRIYRAGTCMIKKVIGGWLSRSAI